MCPRIDARGKLPAALAAALWLAACASHDKPPLLREVHRPPPQATAPPPAPVVQATPVPTPPPAPLPPSAAAAEPDSSAVLYFDSDVYELKDEYRPLLQAHARRLLRDPGLMLRIDAYTDDQGPADYNLELARMRAQAVLKQLVALGVPASRLQAVSHGKARPAGRGSAALASARRVELSYR